MIALSHPTGNANVRAVMTGLDNAGLLHSFHTTLAFDDSQWFLNLLPASLKAQLLRRSFPLVRDKVATRPALELLRLLFKDHGPRFLTQHNVGLFCIDRICKDLDSEVARYLARDARQSHAIKAIYAYEDSALDSFNTAKKFGIKCFYDLPIAYWKTMQTLVKEEATRLPEWAPTLQGVQDPPEKLARKTQEIELADAVICPSKFVYESMPDHVKASKPCLVAEFGTPQSNELPVTGRNQKTHSKLRVLFVGQLTQRKGLADIFAAVKLLNRSDVELVVMGSLLMPMAFYRENYSDFTYEQPRPHTEVLRLMSTCDVLVLPSIVEGRALVQQEAMSCGLPLIVTANAGGEDLIEEGRTGYLVPIRSPELIAERISWLADHRDEAKEMGNYAQQKAAELTWACYETKIVEFIKSNL